MANTANRGYPKPVEGDTVAEEFYRLQQYVLDLIDGDVQALFDAVSGLAPIVHSHAIADVTGLQAALDGKMPASQTFSLKDLTDVSGADAAPDGYVLVSASGVWVALAASAAIGSHQHQSSDIIGLDDTIVDLQGQIDTLEDSVAKAVPSGAVMHFARSTPPTGWLKANGAPVSRTAYAALFAAIGTTFGAGDGSTTFNLPDLRGEFVRGWDDARGVDSGRAFGSAQGDQNKSHTHGASTNSTGAHTHSGTTSSDSHNHTGTTNTTGNHSHTLWIDNAGSTAAGPVSNPSAGDAGAGSTGTAGNHSHSFSTSSDSHSHSFTTGSAGAHSHTVTVDAEGGGEARPRNVALLVCIKY